MPSGRKKSSKTRKTVKRSARIAPGTWNSIQRTNQVFAVLRTVPDAANNLFQRSRRPTRTSFVFSSRPDIELHLHPQKRAIKGKLFCLHFMGKCCILSSPPKRNALYQYEGNKSRRQMLEALQLRFALVGGLFDDIIRRPQTTLDWSVFFIQLVTSGAIDLSNNTELFATCT